MVMATAVPEIPNVRVSGKRRIREPTRVYRLRTAMILGLPTAAKSEELKSTRARFNP
jgi:hypothetical protein